VDISGLGAIFGSESQPIIRRVSYANLPKLLALTLAVSSVLAQDPGMQAAQAAQQAAQISQQASQQAIDQMNQARSRRISRRCRTRSRPRSTRRSAIAASRPNPSLGEAGRVFRGHQAKDEGLDRGAVIYYTTDGWTPTAASTRYTGRLRLTRRPVCKPSPSRPTEAQPCRHRSLYVERSGPTAPVAQTANALPISSAPPSAPDKVVLPRGTAVSFVIASDVSSRTADVGTRSH